MKTRFYLTDKETLRFKEGREICGICFTMCNRHIYFDGDCFYIKDTIKFNKYISNQSILNHINDVIGRPINFKT